MAFSANKVSNTNVPQTTPVPNLNRLSPQEIELLLLLIKRSNFVGEQLENLYNIVIKLQNDYIDQTK